MTEIVTDTINSIDLLQSIYFDDEFQFTSSHDQVTYSTLHSYWESDQWPTPLTTPNSLEFTCKAPIEIPANDSTYTESNLFLTFHGRISLVSIVDYELTLPSASNLWLSRDDHHTLVQAMAEIEGEDRSAQIIERMQQLQAMAESFAISYLQKQREQEEAKKALEDTGPVRFLRDWIWFPMIYTKEKRGDIIDWAPKYNITGFCCPGKPGCMCLEGPEKNVIQFINDIKTISWANIPAGHKKMSSRWKQHYDCLTLDELDSHRLFKEMTEVKFDIYGKFSNHNDLNKLKSWMEERRCGDAFDHLFEYDS